jgi:hypothetical protein
MDMPDGNNNKKTEIKERSKTQFQKYALYFEKKKTKSDNAKIFKEVKFNKIQLDKSDIITKFFEPFTKKNLSLLMNQEKSNMLSQKNTCSLFFFGTFK